MEGPIIIRTEDPTGIPWKPGSVPNTPTVPMAGRATSGGLSNLHRATEGIIGWRLVAHWWSFATVATVATAATVSWCLMAHPETCPLKRSPGNPLLDVFVACLGRKEGLFQVMDCHPSHMFGKATVYLSRIDREGVRSQMSASKNCSCINSPVFLYFFGPFEMTAVLL